MVRITIIINIVGHFLVCHLSGNVLHNRFKRCAAAENEKGFLGYGIKTVVM